MSTAVPTLVITGPVGVGKTTVAEAVSWLLAEAGVPHAVVDLDQLRCCYPRPPRDRFHTALGLRNLAVVWANYRAAGAERLILADVVETRAEVAGYGDAVPGAEIVVVRLRAALPTLHRRLEGREAGASLEWHQERAAELATLMERNQVEDLPVDTDGRSILEVAQEVLSRTGWASALDLPRVV